MNVVTAFPSSSPFLPPMRASRRIATRRDVLLPCQAVRESDFKLISDRTLDVSVDGLLLPVDEPILTGETLIVSFPIPGMWIDAECSVTRVVHGRRPGDDGLLAIGVLFDVISPSARAALAGFLHGKPPPLPRRGPLARLRRGEEGPALADQSIMNQMLVGPPPLASLEDVQQVDEPESGGGIDPVGILRELASAWKRLALAE
ncbi:MAG TPA: PilZ domain-containing protein [Labilithrix sp.]|nr:PilZ domain-containing protein [Labilithrix sp.]